MPHCSSHCSPGRMVLFIGIACVVSGCLALFRRVLLRFVMSRITLRLIVAIVAFLAGST